MARGRQIVRQWKLLRALEAARHRGLSATELVDQLEEGCSQRTLYRDLEQLQAAGFPLLSDEGRWRVLQSGEGGWTVPIEPTEVLALSLVDDLLAPVAGSYLAEPLRELRDRLKAMLTPANRAYLEEMRLTAVATLFGPGDYSERKAELAAIGDAIGRQHRLRLRYAAPGREAQERLVDPYSTWYASGRVYLIAYCHRAEAVRTFALQRIESAEVQDEAFELDPDFDPGVYSRLGFGVFHGPVEAVAIEFRADVAHLVYERRFHHTQRVTELDSGRVRLEMEVAGLPELAAWVAGFGGAARALAPPGLVEAVRRLHEGGLRGMGPAAPGSVPGAGASTRAFTAKQGQYLAFIYLYTKLHRRAPAESELVRHFGVTPPSAHDMVLRLEAAGLIARTPGVGRSVRVLVPAEDLPELE